ncbi:DES5 [Symbiodinium pilosum]|uniref:DES5 protein n=1 Tax=Symbiodinium pilosum TaxID=2952 RepID=A0A812IVA1_SYMPI|nr:DES5 [Symbiodinium pilosum]
MTPADAEDAKPLLPLLASLAARRKALATSKDGDGGQDAAGKRLAEPKPLRKAKAKMKAKSLGDREQYGDKEEKIDGGLMHRTMGLLWPADESTERDGSPDSTRASDSPSETTPATPKEAGPTTYDPNLWYIHGNSYDLHLGYHPWNDKHRKVLKAYGAAPPPPDPFYEEIKMPAGAVKNFPDFSAASIAGQCELFSLRQSEGEDRQRKPVAMKISLLAGCIVATVGTRFSHEGGHQQVSKKEWVNRLCMFAGFFLVGPSMCWYYQHVVSHHVSTNQDGDAERDVDVEYIWIADLLPGWMKALSLPGIFIGTVIELGVKRMIVDLLIRGRVGGHKVDYRLGGILVEIPLWCVLHYMFGPSTLCYLCMYLTAGAIFVPCSQVAHVILYPNSNAYDSWAKMQIAESVDFASDSDFWYHVAFGLTTQIEHHLFPGIGHHCYDTIRLITRDVCKKHGVHHQDVSASIAFSALWKRLVAATPAALLM